LFTEVSKAETIAEVVKESYIVSEPDDENDIEIQLE
jgi:hypothetical protein